MNPQQLDLLKYWITEREAIRKRRKEGLPRPWSSDPIFQTCRFCNVYREHDKVSVWIHKNWLKQNQKSEHLWFYAATARIINWPDTLEEVGLPEPWNPTEFAERLLRRKERKEKVFTGAYMINNAHQRISKAAAVVYFMLDPLYNKALAPSKGQTLEEYHGMLKDEFGFGSFLAGQVVADLKFYDPLRKAKDWWTFAPSGPGSRRGMNILLDRPVRAPWKEPSWRAALRSLQDAIDPWAEEQGLSRIAAHNLQNCLCEFSKYAQAQGGKRPRNLYEGV